MEVHSYGQAGQQERPSWEKHGKGKYAESGRDARAAAPPLAAPVVSTESSQPPLPPSEARVLSVLRQYEALQMDDILEKLEPELSSSEVFTALFELELAGRIRQLPGKNYVRSF